MHVRRLQKRLGMLGQPLTNRSMANDIVNVVEDNLHFLLCGYKKSCLDKN